MPPAFPFVIDVNFYEHRCNLYASEGARRVKKTRRLQEKGLRSLR